jgi:hypothetical protein
MAEHKVFDVRRGLTSPVVEGLRRATRVDLQVVGDNVLALGCWSRIGSTPGAASVRLRVALIAGEVQDNTLARLALSFADPAALRRWKHFATMLCPGDVVRGVWSGTQVSFTVQRRGQEVMEFRQNPAALITG